MNHFFGLEIISCENGYIILEGNSLGTNAPMHIDRRKWVADNDAELAKVVQKLAGESYKSRQEKVQALKK